MLFFIHLGDFRTEGTARERPKRVWNRSETTRKHLPAHHLRIFASSVTASLLYFVFSCRNDVLIFCFGFIAGALSSASFLGKEQSPVSAPKRVWNRSETTLKHPLLTIYNALSLLSLFLSLSLSLSRLLFVSICVSCYPLFRTAACLSGPQCLQLEYVLGACFSGPLHVFPDRNVYS